MLSLQEQETIILFNRDPNEPMKVFTHQRGLAERLQSRGAALVREHTLHGRVIAWTLHCDRAWWREPIPPRRGGLRGVAKQAVLAKMESQETGFKG